MADVALGLVLGLLLGAIGLWVLCASDEKLEKVVIGYSKQPLILKYFSRYWGGAGFVVASGLIILWGLRK
ncbi:hypothetical protein HNR23_003182 [Nocardiopsis mwathae]|uniref:Uncharacterized protein n=1 Tax=Nocardiopsis mwathae TaxID=1472723 RepID=A0A7W9YJA7_9ACTN|nr:hypothetical protein [Nocardiopsis mwathae]